MSCSIESPTKRSSDFISPLFLLATSNIYSQVINVNVIGQVKSPGSKVIPANSSLIEAIMSAGGPIKWKTNLAVNLRLLIS